VIARVRRRERSTFSFSNPALLDRFGIAAEPFESAVVSLGVLRSLNTAFTREQSIISRLSTVTTKYLTVLNRSTGRRLPFARPRWVKRIPIT
jgi:hypothetical protein